MKTDEGSALANALEALPTPPIEAPDSAPFLIIKEEPSETIRVPAEDRVIRVPRRP